MLKFNIVLICIEAYFMLYREKSEKARKWFFILTCIQAILLSGLRHIHVGMDTYNYWNMFERVKSYSWSYLWVSLKTMVSTYEGVEPGFYLSMKIFQIFSKSFRLYLIVFACFVNIPLFVQFYRKSNEGLMSVLIYMTLYFAFVSTTGLRQTMAIVIMGFIGMDFIIERKLRSFLICVLISYTFHKSSLAFLPFYFIAYKKPSRPYFYICLIAVAVLFVLRRPFTVLLASLGGYESYGNQYEGAGTFNYSAKSLAILAMVIWKYKQIIAADKNAVVYINACIISCILLPITFIDPSNLRVVFYYSIMQMFLVPDIYISMERKDRAIMMFAIIALLLAMYFKGNNIYRFMWQPGIYNNNISPV